MGYKGLSGHLPEETFEVRTAHSHNGGGITQTDSFGIVLVNVLKKRPQPVNIALPSCEHSFDSPGVPIMLSEQHEDHSKVSYHREPGLTRRSRHFRMDLLNPMQSL
jgi:hypothetical protein